MFTFQSGPLTNAGADALNRLARQVAAGRNLHAAPPLMVRRGPDGQVALSMDPAGEAVAEDVTAYGQQGGPVTATPSFGGLTLSGGPSLVTSAPSGAAGEIEDAGLYLVIVQAAVGLHLNWTGVATSDGWFGALFTANLSLQASGTSTVLNLSQRQAGAIGSADEGQPVGWAWNYRDDSGVDYSVPGAGSATLMGLINCAGGAANKVSVSLSYVATHFRTTGATHAGTPLYTASGARPAAAFLRLGEAKQRLDPTVTGAWTEFP